MTARAPVRLLLAAGLLLWSASSADAQYTRRQVVTTNGAVTFIGNALGLNKDDGGDDEPGRSGTIGTFITINNGLRDNEDWPFGTTENWRLNSSSAILTLPANSRVVYAELIWAGSYNFGSENVLAFVNDPIDFTTPAGTFSVQSDTATRFIRSGSQDNYYGRTANVTALVTAGGNGTYTVGRVPATQSASEDNFNAAGWTLAVIYENFGLPARNMSVFVGLEPEGGTAASVSGFCTPASGQLQGRVAVSAIEGDYQSDGDSLRFGPTTGSLGRLIGPNNPERNFFRAQINGDDGTLVTTGTFGNRNNNGTRDGDRQGWDITNVDASARLVHGQTQAFVQGTADFESFFINALALQINVGSAAFNFDGATTVNKTTAAVGDTVTYTVRLDNKVGTVDANNVVLTVPAPSGMSFVTGSFTLDGTTMASANPVTGVAIGTIPDGATRVASFQFRPPPQNLWVGDR